MFNIFKRPKKPQKINIMPLGHKSPQHFVSFWEPKYKIGKYIYFNYNTYIKQENGASIYKWETKKLKVIGYEFTFTVDETGNIQGKAQHKVSGDCAYSYSEDNDSFKDENLAIQACTKLNKNKGN